jgi:hypothetical protein
MREVFTERRFLLGGGALISWEGSVKRWRIEYHTGDAVHVTFDTQRWNRDANLLYFYNRGSFALAVNVNRVREMRPA